MYVLVLPHVRVYLGMCARAWRDGTAPRRYRVGLDYSLSYIRAPLFSLLQLVPHRGTTIGAETCRGGETKERVYEAAALL